MGARKKISAEKRKEALKTMYFAKLQNVPTSPRKMRLVADMIRGMEVNRALGVLKFSSKEAAARVEKLLRSAIANWEQKNERKAESGELFVTKIFVDGGATLKRMRPAPQGRGYRIRTVSYTHLDVYKRQTQDYRLSIIPVNDSVYDIKLWERKSSSESPASTTTFLPQIRSFSSMNSSLSTT